MFLYLVVPLSEDQHHRALLLSFRLNEDSVIKHCIMSAKPTDIPDVASSIPFRYFQRLMEALSNLLENSPYLEFILRWCQEFCKAHGHSIQENSRTLHPSLRPVEQGNY
ncbi:hypothetical protein C5167_031774 [Papaver somniferum]|uniref:Small-subunit processome Utp12 domain-containing protein n=1 Tax=Papaver somniferum TaxID=3469 RepID=A0A4Y7K957_PAPSO|nr:hypothetical protein C5167_031774 [Papaver somniferum]